MMRWSRVQTGALVLLILAGSAAAVGAAVSYVPSYVLGPVTRLLQSMFGGLAAVSAVLTAVVLLARRMWGLYEADILCLLVLPDGDAAWATQEGTDSGRPRAPND